MSELVKNNGATDRLIDQLMIQEVSTTDSLTSEHRLLMDAVLLWWLCLGDSIETEQLVADPDMRISGEQTQRLRQQRLLLSALNAVDGTSQPD